MKNVFIIIFIGLSLNLYSQSKVQDVDVYTEWAKAKDPSFDIFAKINTIGSYTIFITAEGVNYDNIVVRKNRKNAKVLTLKPGISNQLLITYYYSRGYKPAKLDSTFLYSLPYSVDKEPVKAIALTDLNEQLLNSRQDAWSAWQFNLNKGDTVFAMRKGLVVKINTDTPSTIISRSSNNNGLLVEHEDGTICYYRVMEKDAFMVSEGDIVFPGTPIGKAGSFGKEEQYQVRVSVHYPITDKSIVKNNPEKKNVFRNVFYNPHFLTTEGKKQLVHNTLHKAGTNKELEQKEMTKKERKKSGL